MHSRGASSLPTVSAPFEMDNSAVKARRGRLSAWTDDDKCPMPVDPDWMVRGACYGKNLTEVFFPKSGSRHKTWGQEMCEDCPVRAVCLEYALENRIEHGTWGGMNERERARLLRARKAQTSTGAA